MRVSRQSHSSNRRSSRSEAIATGLLALRAPAERMLTGALRRTARRKPDVFERLGGFQKSLFVVAPTHSPIAFELRPDPVGGSVRIVRASASKAGVAAVVRGDLSVLLGIFTGEIDADAAFFTRQVSILGDTAAVVTLHNTLEAAELDLSDIAPLPPGSGPLVARALRDAARLGRRLRTASGDAAQERPA